MQWWQKRRARKRLLQDIPNQVAVALEEVERELGSEKQSPGTEPTVFEKLVTTLDDINEGKATREQKIAISIRLVEIANITDQEKATLAEQIEQVYGISATD